MSKKIVKITKASGERESFNEQKLAESIERAGIPPAIQTEAIDYVKDYLYDSITTDEIYSRLLEFLEESDYPQGRVKYSLKRSVMALGPSGYPFERFLAEVLESRGYKTKVGNIVPGLCTKYEVDVIAKKDKECILVECKFHNHAGTQTKTKPVVYVRSAFNDILAAVEEKNSKAIKFTAVMLVTNTKFSPRALKYALCAGVRLLGWDYPDRDSLRDWIQDSGLHPITCLFSLSQNQKEKLLNEEIVLCRDLVETDHRLLKSLNFSSGLIKQAIKEAQAVCQT